MDAQGGGEALELTIHSGSNRGGKKEAPPRASMSMRAGDEAWQWCLQAKDDGGCSGRLSGGGRGQEREDRDGGGWVDRGEEAGWVGRSC